MAHEIAHVAARHAMENQGKGALINYAALAGIIFGGPIVSTVLQNGGGILAGLASLKFSRAAKRKPTRSAFSTFMRPVMIRLRCQLCSRSLPQKTRRSRVR